MCVCAYNSQVQHLQGVSTCVSTWSEGVWVGGWADGVRVCVCGGGIAIRRKCGLGTRAAWRARNGRGEAVVVGK